MELDDSPAGSGGGRPGGGEPGGAGAAGHQAGALVQAGLHVGQDPGVVLGMHQRADLGGRIGRVAHPDACRPGREPGDEIVAYCPFRQNPRTRRTPFAVQGEHPEQGAVDRGVQIGVGEDDAR